MLIPQVIVPVPIHTNTGHGGELGPVGCLFFGFIMLSMSIGMLSAVIHEVFFDNFMFDSWKSKVVGVLIGIIPCIGLVVFSLLMFIVGGLMRL